MKLFPCCLCLLGVALLGLFSLFAGLCVKVDRLGSVDLAQPADSIVVLGARVLPDGRPSEDLLVRTEHAVELYRRGLGKSIVCTGGYSGDPRSAASVARSIAVAYGVPPDDVFLADGSMTTQDDARQTARLMREQEWNTAVLVSHPLHLYRSRLLFEGEGLTVYTSPTNTNLSRIKPQWRIAYTVREALFILWSSVESLGLPRSLGYAIQDRLYGWGRRLSSNWDRATGVPVVP